MLSGTILTCTLNGPLRWYMTHLREKEIHSNEKSSWKNSILGRVLQRNRPRRHLSSCIYLKIYYRHWVMQLRGHNLSSTSYKVSSVIRPQSKGQRSGDQWCKSPSESHIPRTRSASTWEPKKMVILTQAGSKSLFPLLFCSAQTVNMLDDAHPHRLYSIYKFKC